MANSNPPVKNQAHTFRIALKDPANPGRFKVNPNIAAGDFKVAKDGGALANLTNLPAVEPAGSIWVEISLTATEMDADDVAVQAIDQTTPAEWDDWGIDILTTP